MRALIKNGYIVTMDAARATFAHGYVAIHDDGRIAAVGAMPECPSGDGATVIDAAGMIVMPGLINAYTSHWHYLARGAGHAWSGGEAELHAALAARVSADDLGVAAHLHAAAMIANGITTVANRGGLDDALADADAVIAATREAGVRQVFLASFRSPDRADTIRRLVEAHRDPDRRVGIALHAPTAPHDLASGHTSERLIEATQLLAQELDLRVATVSSGGPGHLLYAHDIAQAGRGHVMHLMELGVLDARWLLVQPVLLDDTEIDLMHEARCHAVYTPVHDAMRGLGPGRWAHLAGRINCALGTGGTLFDAGDDMVEQIKACTLVQNVTRLDAGAMPIETGLEMATINAARALGLDHEIGSLEAGKRADVAVFDLRQPHMQVAHKPISVFAATGRGADARAVFVDGTLLMERGQFTRDMDLDRLAHDARSAGARIMRGLSAPTTAARHQEMV